jgi:uncharacterized protein YjiS (DUF1127 family)
MSLSGHMGIRRNTSKPQRFFTSIVALIRHWKFVLYARKTYSAASPLFAWFAKSVCASVRRRRAIAQLSRMDHHELKDLGFPTRSQIECRYFWSL